MIDGEVEIVVWLEAKELMWYLDNNCSRHMMRDKNKFVSLKAKKGKMLIFYDDVGSPREASPSSEELVSNKPQEGSLSQHNFCPKEWKAPRDLSMDNIIKDVKNKH